MKIKHLILAAVPAILVGCESEGGENSFTCGVTMMASASYLNEQLSDLNKVVRTPPEGLTTAESVPARAVGYGSSMAVNRDGEEGRVLLQFQGEGFPAEPGFGVAIVDDSSEVFRGILVVDNDPPPDGYPTIGEISGPSGAMPLIALRINWGSISSERCPLFNAPDSAAAH